MKKAFNILSYLLNIFFISILVIGYVRQVSNPVHEQQDNSEWIKQGIIEREKADLPLNIQKFENIYAIVR